MYGGNNGSLSEGVEDNTEKDSNIYLWLLQKLGPLGMEWTSNSVVTHINEEILSRIRESFTMFNEDLKIKILLTFLHMSRRSLTEVNNQSLSLLLSLKSLLTSIMFCISA